MDVRVLIGPTAGADDLGDDGLRRLYAPPREDWLRVNMVVTLDGAAAGADGRTGSINNATDKRVFDLLRATADAIVVGAGTARVEGYGPTVAPLVVVSRRGEVPERLRGAEQGRVLLVTCAGAPGLTGARDVLGHEGVLVLGEESVELRRLRPALAERGLTRLLGEGGPRLLADLLAAGAVDELCCTVVPTVVGGLQPRITVGPPLDVPLELVTLLEEDGTLLGRWLVRQ